MNIIEKRAQIDEAIAELAKLRDEASLTETPDIDDTISKLVAKRELIITANWDNFKLQITDDDFKKLKEAKVAIDDATATEQEKIEKVEKGIAVGKKILGALKFL